MHSVVVKSIYQKLKKTTMHLITIEKKGIIMYNIYVNDIHF